MSDRGRTLPAVDTGGPRCAACGGPSTGTVEIERCHECGRGPNSSCADPVCGWMVRLFASDDPADCDNCGRRSRDPDDDARLLAANGPCPDCGGPRHTPDRRCMTCSLRRMVEQHKQMEERSGPQYELAKQRSRLMSDAWRAAGSPARLTCVIHGHTDENGWTGQIRWYVHRAYKRGELVEATPDQLTAWRAWQTDSRRLRRELGWDSA